MGEEAVASWRNLLRRLAFCCVGVFVLPHAVRAAEEPPSVLPPPVAVVREPAQLTTHPGQDFSPAISPDGRTVAFVSDRSGNLDLWLLDLARPLAGAAQLTAHSAQDMSPAWSPDGKKIAFISTRSDPNGDLFVMELPRRFERDRPEVPGERARRYTSIETADGEPVWSSSGKSIVFSSASPGEADQNLWQLDLKSGARVQLTKKGGFSPRCSPDGQYLIFTSTREDPGGDIWVLRLSDLAAAKLTEGPALDGFGAWTPDGLGVVFTRYADDTNGDGALTTDDNPSIWRVPFTPDTFLGAKGLPLPMQLTSSRTYDIFPAAGEGMIIFVSNRRGAFNLWRLGPDGLLPPQATIEEQAALAARLATGPSADPYLALLAYRTALVAFASSPQVDLLARCQYGIGEQYLELRNWWQALQVFRIVGALYPGSRRYAGMAEVMQVVARMEEIDAREEAAAIGDAIRWMREVAAIYSDEPAVGAMAAVTTGDLYLRLDAYEDALASFSEVPERYPSERGLCARALYSKAMVYQRFGRDEEVLPSFIGVLKDYGDVHSWARKAAEEIISLTVRIAEGEERKALLWEMAERYEDNATLAALALVEVGDLNAEEGNYDKAREAYERVIAAYPMERDVVAQAQFGLADLAYREEDYDQVLAVYQSIQRSVAPEEPIAELARRSYIQGSLAKASAERRTGEPRLAVKTYQGLIDYNYDLLEAHRGLLATYHTLGEARKGVERYERAAEERPTSATAHYALGLAYTYLDPPRIEAAVGEVTLSVQMNAQAVYPHLTLGWLYEQKERAEPGEGYLERAADEYQIALALNDELADPQAEADIQLNLGNAHYLLGNYSAAFRYYSQRSAAGLPFEHSQTEAVFAQRSGDAALRIGEFAEAKRRLLWAYRLAQEAQDWPTVARIADNLGLVLQEAGEYQEAAGYFAVSLKVNRDLKNWANAAKAQRNIAYNLFQLSATSEGGIDADALSESLDRYLRSLEDVGKYRPTKAPEEEGALFSLRKIIRLGEKGPASSAQYDPRREERLIYTYIGRIYREYGDYPRAIEFLQKKLDMLPSEMQEEGWAAVLTEKSVVQNQLGVLLYGTGDLDGALEAFRSSLVMCMEIENLHGTVVNTANIGKVTAELLAFDPAGLSEEEVLGTVGELHRAVEQMAEEPLYAQRAMAPALKNSAGVLCHSLALRPLEVQPDAKGATVEATLARLAKDFEYAHRAVEEFRGALQMLDNLSDEDALRLREMEVALRTNLASTYELLGMAGEARREFEQALAAAGEFHLWEQQWRVRYQLALLEEEQRTGGLQEAAQMLEEVPLAEDLPDLLSLALQKGLYVNLVRTLLAEGETGEAFAAAERGSAMSWIRLAAGYQLNFADAARQRSYEEVLEMARRLREERRALATAKSGPGDEATRSEVEARFLGVLSEYRSRLGAAAEEDPVLASFLTPHGLGPADLAPLLPPDTVLLRYMRLGDSLAIWVVAGDELAAVTAPLEEGSLNSLLVRLRDEPEVCSASDLQLLSAALLSPVAEYLQGKLRLVLVVEEPFFFVPWAALALDGVPLVERYQVTLAASAGQFAAAMVRRNIYTRSILLSDLPLEQGRSEEVQLPEEVRRRYPTSLVLDGAGGTKAAFLKHAPYYDLIQINNPLALDPSSPLRSVIRFKGVRGEHGRLEMREILGLPLEAHLVVLTHLDTRVAGRRMPDAYGPVIESFIAAGAPSVLVALTEPPRAYAEEFISRFYEQVQSFPCAEALRRTQQTMREDYPDSPYWATYRLFGYGGMEASERAAFAEGELKSAIRRGVSAFRGQAWQGAVKGFEDALTLLDAMGSDAYRDELYGKLAEAAYALGDYERAVAAQQRLVEWWRAAGNSAEEAAALQTLGVIYGNAERYGEAAETLAAALALYESAGLIEEEASGLATLGIVQENASRYQQALASFRDSLRLKEELKDVLGAGEQHRRIGRINYLRLNNYYEAERHFARALEIFEQVGEHPLVVQTLLERGFVREKLGDFSGAAEYSHKAYALADEIEDTLGLSQAANAIGNVAWFRGDYRKAFAEQRKSLKLAEELGDTRQQIFAHNSLGLIYWTLNEHDRALHHLDISLRLAQEIKSKLDEASTYNNIGLVYRSRGDYEAAVSYAEKALAIDEALESRWGIAYDNRNLGMAYRLLGRLDEAKQALVEAVKISHEIGNLINSAKARYSLGTVLFDQGHLDAAHTVFRDAQVLARDIFLPEIEWRALWGQGQVEREQGRMDASKEHLAQAIEIVEQMRAQIKIEELQDGFIKDKLDLYEDMIRLLLDSGAPAEALEYAERSRSRNFIDLLANQKINLKDSVSQELYERQEALKEKIHVLTTTLHQAEEDDQDRLKAELVALREDYQDLLVEIKAEHPHLSSFVAVEPISTQALAELVDEQTALVEYVVAADEVLIWVMREGELTVERVRVPREKVVDLVVRFRGDVQGFHPVDAEAEALYDLLIAPIAPRLAGAKTLCIVPYGPLHYLSFAALQHDGVPMVESFALFYVPSASVLQYTLAKRRPLPAAHKVLAIGNPDLGDFNYDLPLAEKEVGSMRWNFPEITLLTRERARESWVVENISSFDVIHIASHGEFDSVNPLFSSIKLAKDLQADGNLEVNEVFSLEVKADLVALSACQTGLGEVTKGDELIGLNRAFLYAGTHTLLASLWRVSDLSTALLVKHFYRFYQSNNKAESLRKAQLLIRQWYPHPSYWAGFTLTGDYL